MLEAVYPIERRLGELADTVESAYQRYGEKARLREPLKASFTLTLTLVLLLSLFGALYGAFWAARRTGATDPGSRCGHARRRERRLRHAPAAHFAR